MKNVFRSLLALSFVVALISFTYIQADPPGHARAGCINGQQVNPHGICAAIFAPVCGCNCRTYSNPCEASNAGVTSFTAGPCVRDGAECTGSGGI